VKAWAVTTVVARLGGYAVVRLRFPGREGVASLILVLYLVPPALLFITRSGSVALGRAGRGGVPRPAMTGCRRCRRTRDPNALLGPGIAGVATSSPGRPPARHDRRCVESLRQARVFLIARCPCDRGAEPREARPGDTASATWSLRRWPRGSATIPQALPAWRTGSSRSRGAVQSNCGSADSG
jgi:hypothetical protein